MKLALVFLLVALVAISQQQFQYNKVRPRGLFWLSPYYSPQQGVVKSYQHSQQQSAVAQHYYNDFLQNQDQVPSLRNQQWKPSTTRIGEIQEIISFFKNNEDDLNPAAAAVIFQDSPNIVDDEQIDESDENAQARIKFYQQNNKNNGGRFFGSTTINNPFIKTATFTLTSTVTTVGSIVTCVPANNLAAVPAPTCAGRKRRAESEDSDQFPISPSETLKLMPTALPSLDSTVTNNRESRRLSMEHFQMLNPQSVSSSKDEISITGTLEDDQSNSIREKRFFGGGVAASKTVTSYSFIGATLTSTVVLDPTGANVAVCLPAGYVVCP